LNNSYQISKLKKALSYLFPQRIDIAEGIAGARLEVVLNNGKLMLNANQSNYSFGGLHLIFEQLFNQIEIGKCDIKKVLLLGLGAGSVVDLLVNKHELKCEITGVELDGNVIEFAKKYFEIEKYKSLKIVQADAFDYVQTCTDKFDLIVVDLFVGDTVPTAFASEEFIMHLRRLTNEKCCVAYNKMTDNALHKEELKVLSTKFDQVFPGLELFKIYAYGYENSLLCFNTMKNNY
jgi:spermidine synthase